MKRKYFRCVLKILFMISYKNMRFRFGCFLFDLKSFCHFSQLHSSLCALKN